MALDPYSLQSTGFEQIVGAEKGGENLSDLLNSLSGTLQHSGYFGAAYTGGGKQVGFEEMGFGQFEGGDDYGLSEVIGLLEGQFGEGVITDPSEKEEGMQSLLELLKSLNIPGMTQEYGQNVGDVQSEIGSQIQSLIKGRTIGSKGGRYTSIGSGGRNIKGNRSKFLSDYYGLQEKQFTMQEDLQEQLEEDLYSDVGQYMQFNPLAQLEGE